MNKFSASDGEKGVIPLVVLIAVSVAALVGGTYTIKNEIIKVDNGKISLDLSKISNQQQSSPNGESSTKSQQNQNPFTYKPGEEGVYDAPIFYIKPPAGWIKQEKDNIITLTAPDKDKEKVGNKTANLSPKIEIYISNQNVTTLDNFVKATKSLSEDVEYLSDKRLLLNGHEVHSLEIRNINEGIKMHSVSYLLVKDDFEFHVKGGSFDSAWDKRKDAILGSMSSFRFKQEASASEPTPSVTRPSVPSTNQQQTDSTANAIKMSSFNVVFGSEEEIFHDNPHGKKPPIAFSMKEPLDWKKGIASFPDNRSYAVEYEGQEESQTGENGKVMTIRPIISITMTYVPKNKLYSEQNILQSSNNLQKGTFFGKKGYFSEGTTKDYKTGVLSKGQSYIFYENDYQIKISIASLESTWDKWYSSMKKVIDSFKFL